MSTFKPMLCMDMVRLLLGLPSPHSAGFIEGSDNATKDRFRNLFAIPPLSEIARIPF